MKIKKVLFVCSVYKPNIGGIEVVVEQTVRHLQMNGIESTVLTKKFPKTLPAFETVDGLPIFRIDRPQKENDFKNALMHILHYEPKLKADIIHIIGIRRPMSLFGLLLAKKWKVPYLVTFAGSDLPHQNDPESLRLWQEGLDTVPDSVKQADYWTAFSNHTSNLARNVFEQIKKPQVIYGGVDLESIRNVKPATIYRPYFFTACRLEKSKGLDVLVKAFARIALKEPECDLIIAGEGSDKKELENLIRVLSIQKRVKFIGSVNQSTVFSYMKSAIAHICPSRSESGGLVNYEAQAAGCLAIGSDVDGIPEYISDGKSGVLFRSENTNELADKLMLAIDNGNDIRRIKFMALEESRTHGWEMFTKLYVSIYQKLVATNSLHKLRPWSELVKTLANQISI